MVNAAWKVRSSPIRPSATRRRTASCRGWWTNITFSISASPRAAARHSSRSVVSGIGAEGLLGEDVQARVERRLHPPGVQRRGQRHVHGLDVVASQEFGVSLDGLAAEAFGDPFGLGEVTAGDRRDLQTGQAANAGIIRRSAMSAQPSTPIRTGAPAAAPALNVPSPGVR